MLGATRLIRVGTCGGLGDAMAMGDTVIGIARRVTTSTPFRYAALKGYAPSATFGLVERPARLSRDGAGGAVHVGPVVTSGLFYDPDPTKLPGGSGSATSASRWRRRCCTHRGGEGDRGLAIMTVSDLLGESGDTVRISDDALKAGVDQMMRISCAVAVS